MNVMKDIKILNMNLKIIQNLLNESFVHPIQFPNSFFANFSLLYSNLHSSHIGPVNSG